MAPRLLRAAAVLVLLAAPILTATACGGGGGGDGGSADSSTAPRMATGRYGDVHTQICKATDEAEAGDLDAARRTFTDIHAAIHELATAAEEEDRAAAARLLEAKQRVEADLTATTLGALVPPVAEAVEVTGGTAPATCP